MSDSEKCRDCIVGKQSLTPRKSRLGSETSDCITNSGGSDSFSRRNHHANPETQVISMSRCGDRATKRWGGFTLIVRRRLCWIRSKVCGISRHDFGAADVRHDEKSRSGHSGTICSRRCAASIQILIINA